MSSVARRTRKQMNDRLLEMYQEQRKRKEAGSSGSKDGESPATSAPSQCIIIDDSDETMSSNSSGSETNNSDDEDFCIHEDSDEEDSDSSTNTDEINSEMDEDDGRDDYDGGVMEIDSDDNEEDDDEKKLGASTSSTYRKEEGKWKITNKSKDHRRVDKKVREVGKGKEVKKRFNEPDIDSEGRKSSKKFKGHRDDRNLGKEPAKESLHDREETSKRISNKSKEVLKEPVRESLGEEDSDCEGKEYTEKKVRQRGNYSKITMKSKCRLEDKEELEVGKESLNEEDTPDCEGKRDTPDCEGKEKSEEVQERGNSSNMERKSRGVMDILVESIVHCRDAAQDEAKQGDEVPPSEKSSLPLKFRFYDEDEIEPEKDELELECERLFGEMEFHSQYGEETPTDPNQKIEDEAEHYPKAKPKAETICSEEGHDTYLNEEIGLICNRCNKVVTEIKDITPSFAKELREASERRRNLSGQDSALDKFDFPGPEDDEQNPQSYSYGTVWSLIPGIRKNMYPHQQEGFEFLWKNMAGTINLNELKKGNDKVGGGCIISHAPGTGKTRLTIIFLQTYLKMFPQCHPVIIAPAGMLLTWEEEFKKWNFEFPFHNLNNPEFSGKESDSFLRLVSSNKSQDMKVARLVKLGSWSEGKSVLGISYSLYGMTTKETAGLGYQDAQLRKVLLERPQLVVLDEGHTPRNKKSSIWKSCLELQTERRIILSGTPFQNSFDELFNTLELVRPTLAKALDKNLRFADVSRPRSSKYSRKRLRHVETSDSARPTLAKALDKNLRFADVSRPRSSKYSRKRLRHVKTSDSAIQRLKSAMAPFVHVHKGSILQDSLPGLRDAVILLHPPQLQKRMIEENQLLQKKELQGTFEFEYHEAMVSVHPCLSKEKGSSLIEKNKLEKLRLEYDEGAKTMFTVALIHLSFSKPEKEKVLVFSQYIEPLDLIKDQLRERLGYGDSECKSEKFPLYIHQN